jgi:lysozyme
MDKCTKQSLKKRIEKHEGRRAKPYKDTLGNMTGGVGRNLEAIPFSQDEMDLMFENDFKRAVRGAESFPEYRSLSEARQGVILELCFWIGPGGLRKFVRMWAAIRTHRWEKAKKELLDSKLHSQVPGRTEMLANVLLTGEV